MLIMEIDGPRRLAGAATPLAHATPGGRAPCAACGVCTPAHDAISSHHTAHAYFMPCRAGKSIPW
jgi:hypothetical protein